MNDKELLQLAAKAAGCEVLELFDGGNLHVKGPCIHKIGWNPLSDDGDAFHLAVALDIDVLRCRDETTAVYEGKNIDSNFVTEKDGCDKYAATRRAIVRAAAEIGRQMQECNP